MLLSHEGHLSMSGEEIEVAQRQSGRCFVRRDRAVCVLTRTSKQTNPKDSSMQADEVQNTKKPIAARVDLSGQTLSVANNPPPSGRGDFLPASKFATCFVRDF